MNNQFMTKIVHNLWYIQVIKFDIKTNFNLSIKINLYKLIKYFILQCINN